jgi:uncharacterized protein (TIGR02145 family)
LKLFDQKLQDSDLELLCMTLQYVGNLHKDLPSYKPKFQIFMTRLLPFLTLMFAALTTQGQDIKINFTCSMTGSSIEKITATNLTSRQTISLPGTETLVLTQLFPISNGIPESPDLTNSLNAFPNPFAGSTTITASVTEAQQVSVRVITLNGQLITETEAYVQAGENAFRLTVASPDIYLVSITTNRGTSGYKVLCTEAKNSVNGIQYTGMSPGISAGSAGSVLKSSTGTYRIYYVPGDIIRYHCKSCNNQSMVMTDIPVASKMVPVQFSDCIDAGGRGYATVMVGDQLWMAENMAYLPSVSPSSAGSENFPAYYVYGYEDSRVRAAKATSNYVKYGALYNWEAAKSVCPDGWKLPSDADWLALEKFLGMTSEDAEESGLRITGAVGGKLKETGSEFWKIPNKGARNETGFTALPGGYRQMPFPAINGTSDESHDPYGSFSKRNYKGNFWTASEVGKTTAWSRTLGNAENGVTREPDNKSLGFSVRCIKIAANANTPPVAAFTVNPENGTTETKFELDASTSSDAETPADELQIQWDLDGDGTWDTEFDTGKVFNCQFSTPGSYTVVLMVKDGNGLMTTATKTITVVWPSITDPRDGNVYPYKKIGTKTWLIRDMAWLPSVSPGSQGSRTEKLYYVEYYEGTNVAEAKQTDQYKTYGVLYNGVAAKDACPAGWHAATDMEWKEMEKYLGMNDVDLEVFTATWRTSGEVGSKLKESGTTHWANPNIATNTSGFNAIPGGCRMPDGTWATFTVALHWTGTAGGAESTWQRCMINNESGIMRYNEYNDWGMSVRCVKD